jgi:hypothetical protein
MAYPSPPPKPPRGKVRWLLVIFGIFVVLFGFVPIAIGIGLYVADTALSVSDADAEGRLPEATMQFEAEDAQYEVFTFGRGSSGTEASGTTCDITLANGEQQDIDGSRQAVATEGTINSIGTFDAVEGPTEVICRSSATGGRDTKIYVAQDNPTLEIAMYVSIGIGVLMLLAGAGLIVFGSLVRKKPPA